MTVEAERVHVAVAVVFDEHGSVLISRRHQDSHQGGLWEFPGGKIEPEEQVNHALDRELEEELGIRVLSATPLLEVRHDYQDKKVLLDVWLVSSYSGEAHGREGQQVRWVAPGQLVELEFPAANGPIIDAVCDYAAEQLTPGPR